MKNILRIIAIFIVLVLSFSSLHAGNVFDDIFKWNKKETNPYTRLCTDGEDCLQKWAQFAWSVDGIETEKTASKYVQDVVAYLLWFTAFVVVVLIIYSWFIIITANGDEEKFKKAKTLIWYAILGTIIIFLAYPIANFIFDIFLKKA